MIMMKRILLRKQQSPSTRWILTNAYTVAKYQDRNASLAMATAQVYCSRHRRLSTRPSSSRWPSCWTYWRSLLPCSGWWGSTVRGSPSMPPDVLRKMTNAFCTQEVPVKLQIVNLAVKMYLTNPAQTKLIT